ncbi:MAG TPA: hypothetical protein VH560_12855 [Polyangia bacterium]|jgi:hypothetical protein|nr:hypothetical protein [Polyangia bacterium]
MTTNEARLAACAVALALAACRAEIVKAGVDGGPTDAAHARDAEAPPNDASHAADASHADATNAPPIDAGPPCFVGGTTELLPVTVSCAAAPPGRIAVAGDYVYWTVQGGTPVVGRAPLAGGFPEVLASDGTPAVGLAVDARFVYYSQTAAGRIMRVPLAGGSPVAVAMGLDAPLLLALDSTTDGANLYWTGGHAGAGTVTKLVLTSDAAPVVLIDGQSSPRAIAVQDGFVYWTDFVDGTILRTSTVGPDDSGVRTANRLATGLVAPTDLVVAGGFAYAPDQAGHIERVPVAGGVLEDVVDVTGVPYGVATDGLSFYWSTEGSAGAIFTSPLPSNAAVTTPACDVVTNPACHVVPLVSDQNEARFIAVSATAVFWATRGGNAAIHAFAK